MTQPQHLSCALAKSQRRLAHPSAFIQTGMLPYGLAGLMDMSEIWGGFVGQVDLTIDPVAIYIEIKV